MGKKITEGLHWLPIYNLRIETKNQKSIIKNDYFNLENLSLCCFAVFRLNSCALQGFLVQGALLRKSEVDGVLERALEVLPGQLGSTLIPTLCLYSLLGQQQSLKQEVMLHSINSYFLSLFFLAFKFGIV